MNSHEVFIHIHQGCFAGTGARLPQCQWSKPDGYGKISQCITTTKHSKAKTVCIFLGIYCKSGSALAQVTACCLTAPSHYLYHYCLINIGVLWYLRAFSQEVLMNLICNICSKITLVKLLPHLVGTNKLIFASERVRTHWLPILKWTDHENVLYMQNGKFKIDKTWWRHQMETFSALLAFREENPPVTDGSFPHKGQWCGALVLSLICRLTNANNRDAGDLRRHRAHYDVTAMFRVDTMKSMSLSTDLKGQTFLIIATN